jgi:vacuolar-type H+-ATPase subunit E/Vma4
MGIEEVKKEILDSAKSEAKKKISEAEKEKTEVMSLTEEKIQQLKERIESDGERMIEQYKKISVAESNSKIKREKLTIHKEMVNQVFEVASNLLTELPAKKRHEHIIKLLHKANHTISIKKVYCNKKDITAVVNHKAEGVDILGGVIVEDSSGEVRIDLSYESLLEAIKQDSLAEISKLLFE